MFTRALGVLSTLVMARILVPADFGLLAMASTFAAAIDAFSQIGLSQALIRRPENDQRLHDTAFTLQAGRAVVTGVAIALSAPAASAWFNEPRLSELVWALAALSVLSGFRNIGVVAFARDMRFEKQFMLLCVPRLIQVAATIPLALATHSYWALVVGIGVGKVADLVMTYAAHPYRPRLSLVGWRELAAFSAWTWAASIATIIWDRCDPFVLGPALGTAKLGIIMLASEIATMPISEIVAPVSEALFAGFSMAQKQGTSPITKALPAATTLLQIVMPVMIGVSCTSGYAVAAALGPAWGAAQPIVAVAVWLGLFSPFSFVCSTALVSANHVRSNFIANLVVSFVKLGSLVAVVSVTSDLIAITAVGVSVVGLEAAVFVAFLLRAGQTRARDAAGGIIRVLVSGGATMGLLAASGLAWQTVEMPAWRALLIGGTIGLGAMTLYSLLAFALWRASGRPDGPETQVAGLIRQAVAAAAAKVSPVLAGFRRPRDCQP